MGSPTAGGHPGGRGTPSLLVICPSRGRPGNIVELLGCWALTGAVADLVVCVDDDDPKLPKYEATGANLIVGPRKGLCHWINHVAVEQADRYDVFGAIGDDVRPRTPGWDVELCAYVGPLGIVYGNDLHQRERLPTHPFMDAEIVRRLGYMAPPEIPHLYIDDFWKALGDRLGTLVYRGDVVLEHMHPNAGKAAMDDGYRAVNSRQFYRECAAAFRTYMHTRFESDIERLTCESS